VLPARAAWKDLPVCRVQAELAEWDALGVSPLWEQGNPSGDKLLHLALDDSTPGMSFEPQISRPDCGWRPLVVAATRLGDT